MQNTMFLSNNRLALGYSKVVLLKCVLKYIKHSAGDSLIKGLEFAV